MNISAGKTTPNTSRIILKIEQRKYFEVFEQ